LKITGVREFDDIVGEGSSTLFYGVAGVGKTTMLMTIAGNICRKLYPCIYVSTEDTLHYDRVARYPERYENVFFTEIRDFDELLKYVVEVLEFIPYRVLFVDSINALFRIVAYREDSIARYGLMLGLLWKKTWDSKGYFFASAQVRAGFEEDEEEIVASGTNILEYWFDNVFYMGFEDNKRFIEVVKPVEMKGFRRYYLIGDTGIEWVVE